MVSSQRDSKVRVFEKDRPSVAVMKMALPTIISQLFITVHYLADTIFLGRSGNAEALAAVSVVFPVFVMLNAIGTLFGLGGGSEISRLLGEKKAKEGKTIGAFSFWLGLVAAACYSILVYFLANYLLPLVGAERDILPIAKGYCFRTVVLGGIPTACSITLGGLLRGEGNAVFAGIGLAVCGIANILLDYVLIRVLKMGIDGAGLATLLSNVLSLCFYLIVIIFSKKSGLSLKISLKGCSFQKLKPIFSVGIPAAVSVSLTCAANAVLMKKFSAFGSYSVGALGVVKKLDLIPLNISMGLGQGALPIIAYNYAARNYDRMKKVINFTVLSAVILSLVFTAMYELLPSEIVSLFVSGQNVIERGRDIFRISASGLLFMIVFYILNTALQGLEKGSKSLLLVTLKLAILNIPLLLVVNTKLGEGGLLWVEPVTSFVAAAVAVIVYISTIRKLKR